MIKDNVDIRDWFAAKVIMAAYHDLRSNERDEATRQLNSGKILKPFEDVFTAPENIAEVAYDIADAMLSHRGRR